MATSFSFFYEISKKTAKHSAKCFKNERKNKHHFMKIHFFNVNLHEANICIMKKTVIILILLPLLCMGSCREKTDKFTIEATITGIGSSQIFLYAYEGVNQQLVDTTQSNNDIFAFELPLDFPTGMYHVRWGAKPYEGIDILINGENFKLFAHKDSIGETLQFVDSDENELFYAFYPIKLSIRQLISIGDQMNRVDPFGNKQKLMELNEYLDSLEFQTHALIDEIDEKSQELFAYKVIKAAFYPNYDYYFANNKVKKMDAYLFMQSHFFDHIDFNEPALIRTPFVFQAIEDYLSLYVYPPTEESFQKACDMIISKAAVNDEMYDYVSHVLVKTFETTDFWQLYLYLMETYLSDICTDDNIYNDNTRLYKIVKNSRPGSVAQNIYGFSPGDDKVSLHDISAKAIVLLFWDPDCYHCKQIIQELVTVWPSFKEKGLQVAAFSISKDKKEWINSINFHKMEDWIHFTDLKDTKSDVYDKYHIRGTPEIYVLTHDFQIYSRPSNYMMLDSDIMELLNK
jgi:peroxiredoxin